MDATDDFTTYYAELLEGRYDCVDRMVLNAYFSMGQTGGGLRCGWRDLYGDDRTLDDKHLTEMAGTFSRRVSAYCDKHGIPLMETMECRASGLPLPQAAPGWSERAGSDAAGVDRHQK